MRIDALHAYVRIASSYHTSADVIQMVIALEKFKYGGLVHLAWLREIARTWPILQVATGVFP